MPDKAPKDPSQPIGSKSAEDEGWSLTEVVESNVESNPAPIVVGTPLANEKHERFCQLVSAGISRAEAYRKAGYTTKSAAQNAARLYTDEKIRLRIQGLRASIDMKVMAEVENLIEHDVQTRSGRVLELVDRRRAIKRIIAERAVFGPHQDVPGGKTGYVVTRERQLGKDGPIVKEHEFDVAVSRELREIDKQIAMELGQWVEKSDQTRRLASIEDLSDDALLQAIERGRRLKAQREQKPN
jgi:Terminase small subunit